MFIDEKDALANKLEAKDTLILESIYNEDFELWEVSLDNNLLGNFVTEEEAGRFAANIHLAFEMGYTNGLLLGIDDPSEVRTALEKRGIQFRQYLQFDN